MRAWLNRRAEEPHERGFLFVVTYGRSGSTLLMGLLNTIPGYRIRGENANALHHLYQAVRAVRDGRETHQGGNRATDPWYGVDQWRPDGFERALVDAFVANVLRPAPGDRVLGFKEIRYTSEHVKDLDGYLDFLRTAFPQSRIVFNHRLPADVAKSAWWAQNPHALKRIEAADARMRAVPADDRHFHFQFDEIDDSLANIRQLFGWLGEEVDEQRVRRTLQTPHSYRPGEESGVRAMAKRALGAAGLR
ncbi:sulfotransferase [Micromonospora siamensis]|uniref:Sulfotransferase family protein n=1 Tax=Micromonospora siamensis TaxID=299152 RepID=A0A1C5HGL3_9ACTN|nr:sulfotransferase [Micromonospora siamensis]SCG45156.1 Sulfotransferase family protein [Micromonospora siamensis]